MDSVITNCKAHQINDSRGNPTIEVELWSDEIKVVASVPSGRSSGSKEAVEKRDDDRSMSEAILNINGIIAPAIVDKEPNIFEIDKLMIRLDGTSGKSNLGANAILAVSIATVKLGAEIMGVPLWLYIKNLLENENADTVSVIDKNPKFPKLFMNMINGGVHANFALPFQEYIIACDGDTVKESYEKANNIRLKLGEILKEKYGDISLGDEGGYAPVIDDIDEPFKILSSLVKEFSTPPQSPPARGGGDSCFLAIDSAASELYKNGEYEILGKKYSSSELLSLYKHLVKDFNLASIEDPFAENDLDSFAKITGELGDNILIVGDDLTVTNPHFILEAGKNKLANAVIIKPNQIGTISEVLKAVRIAKENGWKLIVSHRSGETMDDFVADLSVGIGAYGIKAGSPVQPERMVKYQRLLKIEREINKK